MLSRLHVKNYILIDSLDIDFPEGLVIVTGQTGAGKSIIIGALGMVLGAKADASVLGDSADNCVIEAEFDAGADDTRLCKALEDMDVEPEDGKIVIRRVISRSGRSRAFINDCPVTVQNLSSISSYLIDIHSQHQTLLLADRHFQLSMLDSFAGDGNLLEEYRKMWDRFVSLRTDLRDVEASISKATAEKDYNEAVFRQLDQARLQSGELEELESEQKRLANAEEIKSCLCGIDSLFNGGYDGEESRSVSSSLKEMLRSLEKISGFIPEAAGLISRLESCRLELDDICSEIEEMNSAVDVAPERLQAVDDRISLLYGLMQRHSCRTVDDLISLRDSLSASISDIESLMDRKASLSEELAALDSEIRAKADEITQARTSAAPLLAEAVQEKLRFLELQFAVFQVKVSSCEMSSSGHDSVQFLFSASGKEPVDVVKCASGGEMSRIMLSLKAIMSRYRKMPTMIFDEIDTGVSGSVADKMGTMICEMGRYMQVFAITHLPQVAAKGSAHYLVSKTIDPVSSKAVTTIKKLSGDQRVMEVARMLSGSSLTDAAVENAKALLQG